MKNGWIAYTGHFLFPWGQAASRRVYGNAMSLVQAGYNVTVASGSETPRTITPVVGSEGMRNFSHIGLGSCPNQSDSQIKKAIRLLFSSSQRTLDWLNAQPTKPSHVILYGGYTPYMMQLLPWCRRNRVALIADIAEWYEPDLQRGGFFGLSNINTTISMRYLFPKCDGIVAISSYLSNFYSKCGNTVLRVPPTLDVSAICLPEIVLARGPKPLSLIYAGSPGKKDLLGNVIDGVAMADPEGNRLSLQVIGPTVSEVCRLLGSKDIPPFVQVLGRIDQQEVQKRVQQADFSVLLREPLRFAQAGFPTKFVESMANGTPVIANITSDLGEYLHDGIEGLVVGDHSPHAFAQTLKRAMCLTRQQLHQMRNAARTQAENSFDYNNYKDTLASFIETVRR